VTQALGLIPAGPGTLNLDNDDTLPVENFITEDFYFENFLVYSYSLFHGKFQLKCGRKLWNKLFFLF
jgi:hypothetical protein